MEVGKVPGLLVLAVLLTMPGARADECGKGEYFHEGLCCAECEAGTFVAAHCNISHSRGKCERCNKGKDYTAHDNGLEACLPCRQCREDQKMVRACTVTQNAECQCKEGYSCADQYCEICQRHSQTHPDGKEIKPNCNATADPKCDLPDQGNRVYYWVAPFLAVSLALFVGLIIFRKKLKCDKATSTHEDAERGLNSEGCIENPILPEMSPEDENSSESPESQALTSVSLEMENTSPEEHSDVSEQGSSPCSGWKHQMMVCLRRVAKSLLPAKCVWNSASQWNGSCRVLRGTLENRDISLREPKGQIIVKDLSQRELRDTFETFIKGVPPKQWKQLMRTHLHDNDIDEIIYKYPNNREEQSYQMLLFWKNSLGEKKCIINLLHELRCIDTKAYDNIFNTLKSNNIICKVEASD